jgi:hypothetical protein
VARSSISCVRASISRTESCARDALVITSVRFGWRVRRPRAS